jgi:hypothetical protein
MMAANARVPRCTALLLDKGDRNPSLLASTQPSAERMQARRKKITLKNHAPKIMPMA